MDSMAGLRHDEDGQGWKEPWPQVHRFFWEGGKDEVNGFKQWRFSCDCGVAMGRACLAGDF